MAEKMTISEALGYIKSLRARHSELINLRNENAKSTKTYFGEKSEFTTPIYNVKNVDRILNKIAAEIRKLDLAIKSANTKFKVDFIIDDSIWGEIE